MRKLFSLIALLCVTSLCTAQTLQDLFKERVRSLVVVKCVVEYENDRSELMRAGVVVDGEGRIIVQQLPPLPPEQFKEFKVLLPGEKGDGYEAVYLGWDPLNGNDFVQVEESARTHLRSITDFTVSRPQVGEELWGIGLLDEDSDYKPALLSDRLSVTQELPLEHGFSLSPLANRGAPVFDMKGALVGWAGRDIIQEVYLYMRGSWFPSAIQRRDETSSFMLAEAFLEQTKRIPQTTGEQPIPWMGVVGIEPLDVDASEFLGLEEQGAVVISDVIEGAAADEAGLKGGDVIVAVDGEKLPDFRPDSVVAEYFFRLIGKSEIGQRLNLTVMRGGDTLEIPLEVGAQPDNSRWAKWAYFEPFGFSIREFLIEDAVRQRSLKLDNPGVVARYVKSDSPASTAGLEAGDWIREIDGEEVDTFARAQEVLDALMEREGLQEFVMMVRRENETKVLRVKLN